MSSKLTEVLQEWEDLQKDFQQIQETHQLYLEKLDEVSKLQNRFSSSISRQRKNLKDLSQTLKKCRKGLPVEEAKQVDEIKNQAQERCGTLIQMESFLPKKNGVYLSLVLGNVNVNLPSKQAKTAYKDEYEKFKLYVTGILFTLAFLSQFFLIYRVVDTVLDFLLVWYYCTLSIRESILINNGSRIKGWWVIHHYISTFLSGAMLTWPDGEPYQMFRTQFLYYCLYQGFVQYLQYYYQNGCLYRLKALGERHNLDLTVEGFQSWMWRGLTFLLPFLFFGHFWQLYNALTLYRMAQLPFCKEWQVVVVGLCFLVLFMGNFSTTLAVFRQKMKNKSQSKNKSL